MRALVTGAAGFIGSHLAEHLLKSTYEVVGVDCLTDFYPPTLKRASIASLSTHERFRFVEADLVACDVGPLVAECDVVFHLAGQPGVRGGWGSDFDVYLTRNVKTTARLLDACRHKRGTRFVLASSSSVYGAGRACALREDLTPQPLTPYGLTKVAAEQLCAMYHCTWGVPTTTLRYFSVFGPRQRPDMAFSKFIEAIRRGQELVVFGDGHQMRDFTYVSDVVAATALAATSAPAGCVVNVGAGRPVAIREAIGTIGRLLGSEPRLRYVPALPGEVLHTQADLGRARDLLGYVPQVSLEEGLRAQIDWMKEGAGVCPVGHTPTPSC